MPIGPSNGFSRRSALRPMSSSMASPCATDHIRDRCPVRMAEPVPDPQFPRGLRRRHQQHASGSARKPRPADRAQARVSRGRFMPATGLGEGRLCRCRSAGKSRAELLTVVRPLQPLRFPRRPDARHDGGPDKARRRRGFSGAGFKGPVRAAVAASEALLQSPRIVIAGFGLGVTRHPAIDPPP